MVDNMNYIELAQQCQLIGMRPHLDGIYQEALGKFAALVAAQEREACAKLCDDMDSISDYYGSRVELICAEAIRARGEA
jgi:hypothetical protein